MSESDSRGKRGRGGKGSRKRRAAGRDRNRDVGRRADLIAAVGHPVRRRMLRLLRESGETRSPIRLARDLDLPLSTVSYHVQVLLALGVLTRTGERQVRGRVERFYEATPEIDGAIAELLGETQDSDEGA